MKFPTPFMHYDKLRLVVQDLLQYPAWANQYDVVQQLLFRASRYPDNRYVQLRLTEPFDKRWPYVGRIMVESSEGERFALFLNQDKQMFEAQKIPARMRLEDKPKRVRF